MAERHNVWKPKTSRFYYCRFTVGGHLFRGSTKQTNRAEAVAFVKDWKKAEIRKYEADGGASRTASVRNMTLLEGADRWFREVGEALASAKKCEWRLDWLVEQIGPKTRLADIDDDVVARLCAQRADTFKRGIAEKGKLSGGTVNAYVLGPLSAILWRAKKWWKVPLPDMPNFSQHRFRTEFRTRELSIPEELALQEYAGDIWDILEFALLSGLRRTELLIRWHDVLWESDRIRVRVKGGRMHEVLITPGIRRILEANRGRHDEYVFTTRQEQYFTGRDVPPRPEKEIGRRITGKNLYDRFKHIAKLAGIKDLTLHDLRRTAGARKYRLTGDIGLVSNFLAHTSIEMTRRHYVHIKLDDVMVRIISAELTQEEKKKEVRVMLAA